MNRLILALTLGFLLMSALMSLGRAQLSMTGIGPASSGPAVPGGSLFLEDGASFLLLEDGISTLCLEGGC